MRIEIATEAVRNFFAAARKLKAGQNMTALPAQSQRVLANRASSATASLPSLHLYSSRMARVN